MGVGDEGRDGQRGHEPQEEKLGIEAHAQKECPQRQRPTLAGLSPSQKREQAGGG